MNIKEFEVVLDVDLSDDFQPLRVVYRSISVVNDNVIASDMKYCAISQVSNHNFVYSEPTVNHTSGIIHKATILLGTPDQFVKIDKSTSFYWEHPLSDRPTDATWVDLNNPLDIFGYLAKLFTPYSVSSALDVLMLSQIDKPIALCVTNFKDPCLSVPQNVKYLYISSDSNPNLEHVYLSADLEYVAVRSLSYSASLPSVVSDILGSDITTSTLIIANTTSQLAFAPLMRIKAVLYLELRGVSIPEITISSYVSEVVRSDIPVIELKLLSRTPVFSLHALLTDSEVRNYSPNALICLFPQEKVTFMSSHPLTSMFLMSGFVRVELAFPRCERFEATSSYNFTARGLFEHLICTLDAKDRFVRYRGELKNYTGTAEVRTYDDIVIPRISGIRFEPELPDRISRNKLS